MTKFSRYWYSVLYPWTRDDIHDPTSGFNSWQEFCRIADDMRNGRLRGIQQTGLPVENGCKRLQAILLQRYRTLVQSTTMTQCPRSRRDLVNLWKRRGSIGVTLSAHLVARGEELATPGAPLSLHEMDQVTTCQVMQTSTTDLRSTRALAQKRHLTSITDRMARAVDPDSINDGLSSFPLTADDTPAPIVPVHSNGMSLAYSGSLTVDYNTATASNTLLLGGNSDTRPSSFNELVSWQENGGRPVETSDEPPPVDYGDGRPASYDMAHERRLSYVLEDDSNRPADSYPDQRHAFDYAVTTVLNRGSLRLVILGGPGSGKSHLSRNLMRTLKFLGFGVCYSALTGAAAAVNEGSTCSRVFQLQGYSKNGTMTSNAKNVVNKIAQNVHLYMIDEVSMLDCSTIVKIDQGLTLSVTSVPGVVTASGTSPAQAAHAVSMFAGRDMIMSGDLMQLPPPYKGGICFYKQLVRSALGKPISATDITATELMMTFKYVTLKGCPRAGTDTEQTERILRIHASEARRPIEPRDVEAFTSKVLTHDAVQRHPELRVAATLFTTNACVWWATDQRIRDWARSFGSPVIAWYAQNDCC